MRIGPLLVHEVFFFFQAEDGIRDLVRSRGLGDVYKRQVIDFSASVDSSIDARAARTLSVASFSNPWIDVRAVSYTHLTLPTSDLV